MEEVSFEADQRISASDSRCSFANYRRIDWKCAFKEINNLKKMAYSSMYLISKGLYNSLMQKTEQGGEDIQIDSLNIRQLNTMSNPNYVKIQQELPKPRYRKLKKPKDLSKDNDSDGDDEQTGIEGMQDGFTQTERDDVIRNDAETQTDLLQVKDGFTQTDNPQVRDGFAQTDFVPRQDGFAQTDKASVMDFSAQARPMSRDASAQAFPSTRDADSQYENVTVSRGDQMGVPLHHYESA